MAADDNPKGLEEKISRHLGESYLGAMGDEDKLVLFENQWTDAAGPGGRQADRDRCACFDQSRMRRGVPVSFHPDRQDAMAPGWLHLLHLVEEAAADGREVFEPLVELSPQERRQIVTLPPTIAKLTAVRKLVLYGSNLVRIPPEIGAMTSLEEFSPYTSHRLHWFPYEITRCSSLRQSTVSTRSLYGNFKLRPPFPRLGPTGSGTDEPDLRDLDPHRWGATGIFRCSVCDRPVDAGSLRQVWLSGRVATDVLPLLVNACSAECVEDLPAPAEGYVSTPHRGGAKVVQPGADWD
ncbi:leucine-rich repeat domain-containing protein [Streptomyces sp. NPDC005808]|uniref:leucine-rich repeat domain-containing protein n=1 Tax=Streptomyces sp. NPDC005808 TaxID=3364734 RepID=UPI00368E57A6